MSQNGPTRPRNMSWDPTGYLDPREVHREQVLFLRVDRTWVHLPGSQGRGPGYGRENFRGFYLFSPYGPPTPGNSTKFTGKGAWLRVRTFSGIFFILSKWTVCTWELYQVHREEVLAPDGSPTTGNSPMGPNRVLGLGDMGKGNELEKSGLTGAP